MKRLHRKNSTMPSESLPVEISCSGATPDFPTSNSRGFTFIELLVVMIILGVLCMLALSQYPTIENWAKAQACKSDIRTLEGYINAYFIDKGTLPNSLNDIPAARGMVDPWKQPFHYVNLVTNPAQARTDWTNTPLNASSPENTDYDLWSAGADLTSNSLKISNADKSTLDDIVRSSNGGFVGSGWELVPP